MLADAAPPTLGSCADGSDVVARAYGLQSSERALDEISDWFLANRAKHVSRRPMRDGSAAMN